MKISHYTNPNAKNIASGIAHVVSIRVLEIKSLVNMGWTKQAAIERVKETTALGPASWKQVLKSIE